MLAGIKCFGLDLIFLLKISLFQFYFLKISFFENFFPVGIKKMSAGIKTILAEIKCFGPGFNFFKIENQSFVVFLKLFLTYFWLE